MPKKREQYAKSHYKRHYVGVKERGFHVVGKDSISEHRDTGQSIGRGVPMDEDQLLHIEPTELHECLDLLKEWGVTA
jgi:hypothetical protein